MSVSIPITDLAPLCQMDHYNNFSRVACNVWSKLSPDTYSKYKKKFYKKGQYIANDNMYQKMTVLNSKIAADEINIINEIRQINKTKNSTSDLINKQEKLITRIENTVNSKKFKSQEEVNEAKQNLSDLKKLVKSSTNVVYGKKNENDGYTIFEKETEKIVKAKQVSVRMAFCKTENGIIWYLNGIADGLTTSNELIEIKNRQKKLFKRVRDYEMCQIQSYLYITKHPLCYLVELIEKDFEIIEVQRETNYFQKVIKQNILRFINFMESLFLDDSEEFYSHDEKEALMDELIRGDPNKVVYSLVYA